MTTPIEILKARLLAIKHYPYFAAALWRVSFTPTPGLFKAAGPMAVDKRWRVYYDPDVLQTLTLEQWAFCLLHEINHCLRIHAKRRQDRIPLLWNIAGDLEINDDILREGKLTVISKEFTPLRVADFGVHAGQTAEQYYEALKKNAKIIKVSCNCGSGANGERQGFEQGSRQGDGEQKGKLRDGEDPCGGVSETEGELIRREVAKAAKAHGHVPAGMSRWVEDTLDPKVDWRTLLARYLRAAGQTVAGCLDYSYSRPSRRSWPGFVMPRMIARQATVGIVFDTSGSMSKDLLESALAEVRGIAKAGNMAAAVYFTDAEVASTGKAGEAGLSGKMSGGGGTDMRVGMKVALKAKPKPDVLVVLTDGFTDWPLAEPEVPVIIGLVRAEGIMEDSYSTPEWAKVVDLG